ncbi:hypothetical protein SDC9_134851 [bioreactor metagenome]|uniref:Uncharacterized protein n=1 Tax=bioreactor metagenome TaxID=1076179 RepID=A0A645DES6_9ZZZZ
MELWDSSDSVEVAEGSMEEVDNVFFAGSSKEYKY